MLRLEDPGLSEGANHDAKPDERDDRGAGGRQETRPASLEGEPFEDPSGVDHQKPDAGEDYSQSHAERDDENHPELQPAQRDRAQQQDQSRRTRHQTTTHAEPHETAPGHRRPIRPRWQVTVPMAPIRMCMFVVVRVLVTM